MADPVASCFLVNFSSNFLHDHLFPNIPHSQASQSPQRYSIILANCNNHQTPSTPDPPSNSRHQPGMSSFTESKKVDAQPNLPSSTGSNAANGDNKTTTTQSANERLSYHTKNMDGAPLSRGAPQDVAARIQNAGGNSPQRRVAWTAVRALSTGQESFAKYLDDGAFVVAGNRPAPPPAPETFVPAAFPTLRDEELMEKGQKLGVHAGKGHGDVVDEVVYKGRGKKGGKDVGEHNSQGDKVDEKQETVAGKKNFGRFNAILYGPPSGASGQQKK
ncbi:hypothetical protein TI39_contig395g00003 [Zymoseptoria brevis]|uniref:Uncharacterized protein n=1 Tax=Zymoseptoria brevis TaxID=1047168 RepID=A0A0F4GMU6_9PEZI|nr:hypothetical protein TI39_contig395g00003 [Zymoseptoria brevis]